MRRPVEQTVFAALFVIQHKLYGSRPLPAIESSKRVGRSRENQRVTCHEIVPLVSARCKGNLALWPIVFSTYSFLALIFSQCTATTPTKVGWLPDRPRVALLSL